MQNSQCFLCLVFRLFSCVGLLQLEWTSLRREIDYGGVDRPGVEGITPGAPHMGAGARLGERTKYPFYHIVLEIVIQIQQIDSLNGFPDEHQLTIF